MDKNTTPNEKSSRTKHIIYGSLGLLVPFLLSWLPPLMTGAVLTYRTIIQGSVIVGFTLMGLANIFKSRLGDPTPCLAYWNGILLGLILYVAIYV